MTRRYPAHRDSGVEWLGEVPEGWEVVRLKSILAEPLKYGANEASDGDDPAQPRFVRITDIDGDARLREDTFRSLPFDLAEPYILQDGDILFARSGATVGKSFIYSEVWGQCCYAGYLIRARPSKLRVFAKFLFQCCQSDFYWQYIGSDQIQSTIQNFSAEKYANFWLPLPPLPEQTAIAAFLDRETAKIDGLVAEQRRLIDLLREKRQAVISHAVTRGLNPAAPLKPSGIDWLGEVPEGWEVIKLSALFRASKGPRGQTLTKEYCGQFPGEYPVYSGQTDNLGVMGSIEDFDFDAGDEGVLFSTTVGAKAMTVSHILGKFSLSQNCMIISPISEEVRPRFFFHHFQPLFAYCRSQIPDHMQPSFRMSDLYQFKIALPPKSEQEAIASTLDALSTEFDALTTTAESAIALLQERRAALISAAVTGKIDVRHLAQQETDSA